jgi:hypothetical protein
LLSGRRLADREPPLIELAVVMSYKQALLDRDLRMEFPLVAYNSGRWQGPLLASSSTNGLLTSVLRGFESSRRSAIDHRLHHLPREVQPYAAEFMDRLKAIEANETIKHEQKLTDFRAENRSLFSLRRGSRWTGGIAIGDCQDYFDEVCVCSCPFVDRGALPIVSVSCTPQFERCIARRKHD